MRPFIICCKSRDDTRMMLGRLAKLGYAKDIGSTYTKWADDYPTFWTIGVHSQGRGVNTRSSVANLKREIPGVTFDDAIIFNSTRHFLTSRHHVNVKGEPQARRPDSA